MVRSSAAHPAFATTSHCWCEPQTFKCSFELDQCWKAPENENRDELLAGMRQLMKHWTPEWFPTWEIVGSGKQCLRPFGIGHISLRAKLQGRVKSFNCTPSPQVPGNPLSPSSSQYAAMMARLTSTAAQVALSASWSGWILR